MIQRFKNSWNLFVNSVDVLMRYPKLLLFPLVTACCVIAIALFFLGTFLFQPTGHSYSDKAHWKSVATSVFTAESLNELKQTKKDDPKRTLQLNGNGMGIAAAIYFLSMFLATFFNVAFYHEILLALRGQPISVRQGLRFAMSRLGAIVMWSLFAGAIGYLIRVIEERLGFIGKITMGIIGLTWSVAAVFAIPVIVAETSSNPLSVLRSSAASMKKTWGESLIGFSGFGVASLLSLLTCSVIFMVLISVASILGSSFLMFTAMVGWVLFLFGFSYFTGVASNVFRGALYVFASTGIIPDGYSREMLDAAWRHKR